MGFYHKHIFPCLMDFALSGAKISGYRKKLLSGIEGKVLEIGFGTGLNLPHYSSRVKQLTVVEPNPGMIRRARKRIAKSPLEVEFHAMKGEKLPFENRSFDSVVITFTLCSIPDPDPALWEIHRVLKNGGKLFFMEHGLSSDPKVRKWQRRLTPLQRHLGDGCHLDRDMASLIEGAGFRFLDIKKFYCKGLPKIGGFFYQGIAEKAG